VQLSAIVKLAHAMEDCFVAAMNGKIVLNEAAYDKLLEGVDLIRDFSKINENEVNDFMAENLDRFSSLVSAYADIKESKSPSPVKAAQPETQTAKLEERPEKKAVGKDNFVRVAAEKLNKLMGLAGELMVDAKHLHSFEKRILDLKKKFIAVSEIGTGLHDAATTRNLDENTKELIASLRKDVNGFYGELNDFFSEFSDFTIKSDNFSHKLYDETLSCKIRPFEDVAAAFPRIVRDAARTLGRNRQRHSGKSRSASHAYYKKCRGSRDRTT